MGNSMPRLVSRATGPLAVIALLCAPASAKKFETPPMPPSYDDPGPEPQNPLANIAIGLRTALKDPYSVRDFSLCQSHVMPPTPALSPTLPWSPAFRITLFKLNVKNSFGGYTGQQAGIATFKKGLPVKISLIGVPGETDRERTWREPCQSVPDAEIQGLIEKAP